MVPLNNHGNYVGVTVDVGTPAQRVELLLDTGSDVSWVVTPENGSCMDESDDTVEQQDVGHDGHDDEDDEDASGLMDCHKNGMYECKNSSTCIRSREPVHVRYGDTTSITGVYAHDTVSLGGNVSLGYDFALGLDTNSSFGVLALGIPDYDMQGGKPHYVHGNLAMRMKEQGMTERAVFSVWFNEEQSGGGGELLFGASDRAKYKGNLTAMRIVRRDGEHVPVRRFDVLLSDILVQRDGKEQALFGMSERYSGGLATALPDTGSMLTYLPTELYDSLTSLFPERLALSNNKFAVGCPMDGDTIGFKFGSTTLTIPLWHFISDRGWGFPSLSKHPGYDPRRRYCLLGFMSTGGGGEEVVLGHAFLRATYTVFDLDRMQILLAPAVYTNKSHIEPFTLHSQPVTLLDGEVANAELTGPAMLDPATDFISDTRGGFYKRPYTSRGHRRRGGRTPRTGALRWLLPLLPVFAFVV